MADNKHIVKKAGGYGRDGDGSYVAFDSRYPANYVPQNDVGDSVGASKAATVLNRMNAGNTTISEDMGVWRGVTPGYASNTHGQAAIQGLQDLMKMTEGSDLVVYDTEILGTTPFNRKTAAHADFYAPTEVGFQHVKMINGKLEKQSKSLSMLLRPNQEVYKRLDAAINDLSSKKWSGLTEDMRRTLSDLTLYAGDTSRMFNEEYKDGRRIVSVNEQARHLRPMNGVALTGSDTIANMRRGLENLMQWGTSPEDALIEMNSFMKGFQNTRFAGYNVYSFDQPMMLDYLNTQVGKHNPNSPSGKALDRLKQTMALNQIDGLHAVRTLYRDLYERYGDRTTLERMKSVLGIADNGQAHHALSDVQTTIEQLNALIKDPKVASVLNTGSSPGGDFAYFNNKTLKVGDRLFGVNGMNSRNAGAYDGIYRMKEGKLHSAYDMTPNPIYRNTSYTIKNFFDGIKIDDKKMYGIHLYNEDDGLHHTIFRETQSELQNAVHQHLQYVDERTAGHANAHVGQNEDRAMRRWNKMFSMENGGGVQLANRLYNALDIWNKGINEGLDVDSIRKNIVNAHDYNTDEFVRDFETMKGRLEQEKPWITGALDRLQTAMPVTKPDDFGGYRAQSMVFSEFGKNLDKEFGVNAKERSLHGGQALQITIGGDTSYLNLGNADSIRANLYGQLYKGHVDRPDLATIRTRYKQLLIQLKSYNALEAKKFEKMYKGLDNVRSDASLDNMLNDISNAIVKARETATLQGALTGVTVEDPTGLNETRKKAMETKGFDSNFERIFNESHAAVQPYTTKWKEGPIHLFGDGASELVDTHDKAIKMLMERNGLNKAHGIDLRNLKSSRSSLAELAQAFASNDMHVQFRYDGKRKGLQMVLADKGVSESLLNGSIKDIMKSNKAAVIDLPRLMHDGSLTLGSQNRVARFRARRTNSGYELATGFDEIINTLKHNAGTVRTMLDDARKMSKKDGKDNGILMVHDYLNRRAKKAMQNLSMNNRYSSMTGADNPWETKSLAANWVRSGLVDISDTAEDWYTGWYAETKRKDPNRIDLWRLKTPEQVRELASKNGELFVNSMGMNARRVFQRQSDQFWNEKTGMNVGMHSVKDVHVSNYLRANLDARELLAFGFYNPMGRENIMKTVNYDSLDRGRVVANLKEQGYSDQEINRMVNRGVVSEGALDVMEEYKTSDRLSYVNMRTAYMNDQQLSDRTQGLKERYLQEAWEAKKAGDTGRWKQLKKNVKSLKSVERVSTYDGMFLMAEEAGQAFNTTREKRIKLGAGEELTEEIKTLMMTKLDPAMWSEKEAQINFDTMSFGPDDWNKIKGQPKLLTNLGSTVDTRHSFQNSGGKLTVSEVVKYDLAHETVTDEHGNESKKVIYDGLTPQMERQVVKQGQVYDKWYANQAWIKGWDHENRELILEEQVNTMNSTKAITEAGHRATATLMPGEVIRDLSGHTSAQAIMPQFEMSKGMHGTELSRMVSLAVDEANRQIDNGGIVTAGKIAKEDALQEINRIMQESFNIGSSLSYVKDGQIVLNRFLGSDGAKMDYTAKNMEKFASKMNTYLGTDMFNGVHLDGTDGTVHVGNLGVGRQNVYDWENGVGLVDKNSAGLVRYGRKEVDMITARANSVLGRGSAVVGWLGEHIEQSAMAQNKDIRRIAHGLIKATVYRDEITPDAGDVVIRTSDTGAFHSDDPNGIEHGRTRADGVREISMHALNDIPEVTAKDTVRTAQMYARTIIDFGRTQGKFEDGVSFAQAFKNNGGTALLELPNSDAITRRYLRLVDFGDITKGDTAVVPVTRELQTIQQQLWRNIQQYNTMNMNGKLSEGETTEMRERLEGRINDLADSYENKAAAMISNSRDGGLQKTFGAAKMGNAGRFRIQGVNPFANYEQGADGNWAQKAGSTYQEGAMYVSRDRLKEMVTDRGYANETTMRIAKAMGLEDEIAKNGWNLADHGEQILNKVLDNVNEKGLYGFVNRYPTIKQSTIQSMKIMIDDAIDPSDRTGRLTVGTAARLKADYDGDFLSAVLSHYSIDDDKRAMAIHGELKELNGIETQEAHKEGSRIVAELHDDMFNTAKSMNITMGELSKQVNEAEAVREQMRQGVEGAELKPEQKSLLMKFGDEGVKSKYLNPEDILETREARLGKEFVGMIDNARDRIVNLSTATLDTLEAHGRIKADTASNWRTAGADLRNAIEDFTAGFSQDSISAKKFSVEAEIERQFKLDDNLKFENPDHMATARSRAMEAVDVRYNKLQDMIEALMNPTEENKQRFIDHNQEIQVFKGAEGEAKMKNALDMVQKVAVWNNRTGSYFNESLKLGQSLGQDQSRVAGIALGMQNHVVPTETTNNIKNWAPGGEITESIQGSQDRWARSLLSTYDRVESGGDQSLIESIGRRGFDESQHVLSGATVAEEGHQKLTSMIGKFAPSLGHMGGGAGRGALAFGAMWAASALIRSGPTPEGLQEMTSLQNPPPGPQMDTNPTARVTQNNGEYVNIKVNAKNAKNMSEQQIAALVHEELGAMANVKLDTNVNVNDNTQNIDPNWLQGVVAKAINGGFAF
jgi:hypothetical protein